MVQVFGKVSMREGDTVNSALKTGEIEVVAENMVVHNICETLPFPLDDEKADKVNEDLRLQYRYLDLRRPRNLNLLRLRHKAAKALREYLDSQDFTEVETPILFKSTPEGAREFLVPSRLNAGQFYALNQSPQQYKQMLMVSGIERYYQMAKCFRDEDLRADRQPEFTQVDIEMSFIDREDMYSLIENMLKKVWKDVLGVDIPTPFKRMPYSEAMNRYGVDKPDTRFGMELNDLADVFRQSQFKVFASVANGGGAVKAINAKGLADITQGELKNLEDVAKTLGAKGLAFIKAENGAWKSPILKFLSETEQAELKNRLNIEDGDIVFFAACEWERACSILGRVRLECAKLLQARGKLSIPSDQFNFLWVIEFPLMLFDEEQGRYVSAHHPFTSPVEEDVQYLDSDPLRVRGPALRHSPQRRRARRRLHKDTPAAGAGKGVPRRAQNSGRHNRVAVRLHAQSLQIRRPAARGNRARFRQAREHTRKPPEHTRHHRLPQDPARPGPHGAVAVSGDGKTAERPAYRPRRRRAVGTLQLNRECADSPCGGARFFCAAQKNKPRNHAARAVSYNACGN